LPEIAVAVALAAALTALFAWRFPARHEAGDSPRTRALRAAVSVALVLAAMLTAQHLWPHSRMAMPLGAVVGMVMAGLVRGLAERRPARRR
jgi:peptidoglycan biosynthesis protein MviN/MurJ (putative lipid II flippase)